MHSIQTEVLVIGGGATGTGVARDLAMRGFKTILVEKGDLTHGTSGRYHGLLHSGGRYVVRDPLAARECIEENRILRRILPQCLEDTGGFFVLTPWDDPEYAPLFLKGCKEAGIPVEEVSVQQMLREEPLLNPKILRCFRVPDASADSFLAAELNALSARQYGAQILPYHKVTKLITNDGSPSNGNVQVVGARCINLVKNEEINIYADIVVNACGAWAGKIAATVGIPIQILGGKGTMIAMNHRLVHTVINRCRMPTDGDILVPAHTVCVIGTTDVKIPDPDQVSIEPWEIHLLLEEGEKLIPGFKDMRVLRAWAGIRPLYQETEVQDTRQVTRAFVLLDHAERDGISGIVTITSGKWTTYRKMAEVTADLVCKKLGAYRPCRTHLEPLPKPDKGRYHYLGARLAKAEAEAAYGRLICECELATYDEVMHSIEAGAVTIDDVRRDTRLGMGPCQGGFCTYRVAGLLHRAHHNRDEDQDKSRIIGINVALRDFLQERWKGVYPTLWGQQLRQERLAEQIYISVLSADRLPGPMASRLAPELYAPPASPAVAVEAIPKEVKITPPSPPTSFPADILIIGGGLAGLVTAWQAALRGKSVHLVTKGRGALYWGSGCVDILGITDRENNPNRKSLYQELQDFIQQNSHHPYAKIGLVEIQAALDALKSLCDTAGYPMYGSLERLWLLPSALGTLRLTCLAPETMIAGDLGRDDAILIVGFEQFLDFYPHLIAENLIYQGISARGLALDLPSLRKRRFVTGYVLAALFETPAFQQEVIDSLKSQIDGAARIGFPAILGINNATQIKRDMESALGLPVFEIPTLPPSIPGIRLQNILLEAIKRHGGQVSEGIEVKTATIEGNRIKAVWSESAARLLPHVADNFVLATGGFLGGGYYVGYNGYAHETVFNLPVSPRLAPSHWFDRQFLNTQGHPIFKIGIRTDALLRPLDASDKPIYENLYVVGGALGGYDGIRERSLEGVALASGYMAGKRLSE